MRGYNFAYFLREGVKSIFLHGFMSFAAVSVIVACLLITGTFTLLAFNVNEVIEDMENSNEILAIIDEQYSDTEALAVGGKIYQIENVKSAEYISREDAYSDFGISLGEDAGLLEGVEPSALRIKYRIFIEDVTQLGDTVEELKGIKEIADVKASVEVSDAIVTMRAIVNIVCTILAAILMLVSVFIISNTVKLATFDRREEIAIMKIVGATNSFIRWPFVVEGFLLGIFGGAIAFFGEWGLYLYAGSIISGHTNIISLVPFSSIAVPMFLIFVVVGFIVGVFGGVSSIRKYMKV